MRWAAFSVLVFAGCGGPTWSDDERDILATMAAVQAVPSDPTNAWADDPEAAALGKALFFSPLLSRDGELSCASCHDPRFDFADGRRVSEGAMTNPRHAPTIVNAVYQRWQFWDGRCDSLWCQAIGPVESELEMANNRTRMARSLYEDPVLRQSYEDLFGAMPPMGEPRFPEDARPVEDDLEDPEGIAWSQMTAADQQAVTGVLVNTAKAIAAWERRVVTDEAPLDRYLQGWAAGDSSYREQLSAEAERGLALFVGDGLCHFCHSGPMLTNGEFHNVALGGRDWLPAGDNGRFDGIARVKSNPFNATGPWSDDTEGDAARRLEFLALSIEAEGQFKTPGLRRVARTAPYMHGGHLEDLRSVVAFYNEQEEVPEFGHLDETLAPLGLDERDIDDLVRFMEEALDAPMRYPDEVAAP